MHFVITADGHQKLVTHTFVGGGDYLESDAVFGVKMSLIAPFETIDGGEIALRSRFDFVLIPA
jgi:catechol 1,2-dioxygenase